MSNLGLNLSVYTEDSSVKDSKNDSQKCIQKLQLSSLGSHLQHLYSTQDHYRSGLNHLDRVS